MLLDGAGLRTEVGVTWSSSAKVVNVSVLRCGNQNRELFRGVQRGERDFGPKFIAQVILRIISSGFKSGSCTHPGPSRETKMSAIEYN